MSNDSDLDIGMNIGGGFRLLHDDLLTGNPRIFGISGWYDRDATQLDNYFNQAGVSFESLGEMFDFRLNAYFPIEDQLNGDKIVVTDAITYVGNSLSQATIIPADVALRVVDFEVAMRPLPYNVWAYTGGYQMDGNHVSELGAKAGIRGYLTNDLVVDVGVSDDDQFGTNTSFQIIWTPGRTGPGCPSWFHTIGDRFREPVYRNTYVATKQIETDGAMALTDVDGDDIRVVHVDSRPQRLATERLKVR